MSLSYKSAGVVDREHIHNQLLSIDRSGTSSQKCVCTTPEGGGMDIYKKNFLVFIGGGWSMFIRKFGTLQRGFNFRFKNNFVEVCCSQKSV